ncbi:MAG: phasin family protein [Acetobacterales bacterium]
MTAASTAAKKSANGAPNFNMDFSKYIADFKFPKVDVDALVASQTKTVEAVSSANRTAVEGAQAVVKRHNEVVQSMMTEMSDAMKELASIEKPQERAAKQAQICKSTYERAVANAQEIGDMIAKSNAEAFSTVNKRFLESLDEAAALLRKGN